MSRTISATVVGASGYTGGELLRLLLAHPYVDVKSVTSEQNAGWPVWKVHPNLRGFCDLQFVNAERAVTDVDVTFLCTPHGVSMNLVPALFSQGLRVIDLSSDYRMTDPRSYEIWYARNHEHPELLKESVYGLPELHRDEIKNARLVASPGCLATSAILALAPLIHSRMADEQCIVIDAKAGSSAGGSKPGADSHHPTRSNTVRAYKPVGHRHTGEIEQELSRLAQRPVRVAFSAHAIELVRGIFTTTHAFLQDQLDEKQLWKAYRTFYANAPFVRLVNEKEGMHRFPEPKLVLGTNFCDIGFALDPHTRRVVVLSALDNLVKGAAGQAMQCMNLMFGMDERTGLWTPSVYPV